jgi:hypothetical protein
MQESICSVYIRFCEKKSGLVLLLVADLEKKIRPSGLQHGPVERKTF